MTDEEHVTAELLRLAGQALDPPAERTLRVREAVRREWHAHRRRRTLRRMTVGIALAGVAAMVVLAVWISRSGRVMTPAADIVVAVSERVQGQPLVLRGNGHGDRRWPLAPASSVTADEMVATDAASRAALRTADGSSVRIDRASRVRFVGPGVIEVLDGAAYVATSDRSRGFEIRTPLGIVRDVGTQFEVRVSGSSVRLRVRTGAVTIRRGASVTPAGAGTEATVTSAGIAVRQVPAFGTEWSWASALAVPFAIDGRSLRAFLEHIVAEEGWRLRYADRELGDAAGRIILHGSVEGLGAEDALRVALATSGLRYRLADGELLVFRASDER